MSRVIQDKFKILLKRGIQFRTSLSRDNKYIHLRNLFHLFVEHQRKRKPANFPVKRFESMVYAPPPPVGCTLRNCESSLLVQRRVQLIKRRRSVAH